MLGATKPKHPFTARRVLLFILFVVLSLVAAVLAIRAELLFPPCHKQYGRCCEDGSCRKYGESDNDCIDRKCPAYADGDGC
jgi:hypothetical protein